MFSTAYPQVFNILVISLTLLVNVVLVWLSYKQNGKTRGALRDVDDTKLDIADLKDRFVGFQKRDGMRKVRADKTSEADTLAELQTLAAGQRSSEPPDIKAALRRKLRNH